jgi:hypothetical protein
MRNKLTKFEEAFIELHRNNMNLEQLTEEIGTISKNVIQKYLDDHPINEPKMPTTEELMIKKSGATIMTENASALSEELKKHKQPQKKHFNDCTTKAKR